MENIKNILKRISLGEASPEDREILNSLNDEVFYSELESLEKENSLPQVSAIEILIEETREEIKELDSTYSEIIPESSNIQKVRSYAKNKSLVKRFLKKQRVK